MAQNTILILGDSTSMTVGVERSMYPFQLADAPQWRESTTFVNCSLPGITSADACAFFFRYLKQSARPRAVILGLGTCDAMSSELRKGRYTPSRELADQFRQRFGIAPPKTKLRNRLLHFEWNGQFNDSIEQPEAPEDFRFNIERVLKACQARSIPVVLMRPKSNPLCPPGIARGNFVFYAYLGIPARFPDRFEIPDARYVNAVRLSDDARHEEAATAYHAILSDVGVLATHPEYALIVANNYAVAVANAGRLEEAASVLQLLLKERGIRREIILYNLAQVARMGGRIDDYNRLMEESYEADASLYRIRGPYLDAIDDLGRKYSSSVWILDLHRVLADECFVDHTHALPEGQKQIADAMAAQFDVWGLRGSSQATIENVLFNPELSKGNATRFYDYFRAFAAMTPEAIRQSADRLRQALDRPDAEAQPAVLRAAPKEVREAIEYALRHPAFPTVRDVLRAGPQYPSDVGRFPEMFLIRVLIPYLRAHEHEPTPAARFDPASGLLRRAADLARILPDEVLPLVADGLPVLDPLEASRYVSAILEKVRTQLSQHLRSGNRVFERLKSTMFFYFRETLRYGSHSRVSMRYDRTSLEWAAEALAVAGVLDVRHGLDQQAEIQRLAELLTETVKTHDLFSALVSLKPGAESSLGEYDHRLRQLADRMASDLAIDPLDHPQCPGSEG